MVELSACRHAILTVILAGAAVGQAAAATIYGSVSANQQPVSNRDIELVCPGQTTPGKTDARGSYRFTVGAVGSCTLRMGTAEAPVILSANPAQYNFDLRNVNGHLALVQR